MAKIIKLGIRCFLPPNSSAKKGAASVDLQPLHRFQRFYKSDKSNAIFSRFRGDVHL